MEQRGPAYLTTGQFTPHALGGRDQPEAVQNARHQAYEMRKQSMERNNKVQLLYAQAVVLTTYLTHMVFKPT